MKKWDLCGFVISSGQRSKVLSCLATPKTPSMIAKELKLSLAHASKIVRELEKRKLIVCLNPSATKGRLHKRTKIGDEIIKYLEKNL